MSNPNFDNIVATTLKKYFAPDGKAVDNIFKRTALLNWLKDSAKIDAQGGATAVAPLMYASNSSFQWYSDYDVLTPVHGEEIATAAEYNWKQAAIYIPMSGMEEAKNSGDRAIVNLLKAKTENAERTAAEQFETAFLQYSGTEGSGKAWAGLPTLVGDNTSTVTTVGGIDSTTQAYWRSSVNLTPAALTLAGLSNAYNTVSWPGDAVDFEITTQALWEKFEGLLQPQQRFMDPKTAESGFSNLIHRGGKVVWSDLMPSGKWYFLNSRHLKLAVLDGKWMNFRGFVEPFDRDAKYGLITCYGSLMTDERRKLAVRAYT
jgi:hypothetical protein